MDAGEDISVKSKPTIWGLSACAELFIDMALYPLEMTKMQTSAMEAFSAIFGVLGDNQDDSGNLLPLLLHGQGKSHGNVLQERRSCAPETYSQLMQPAIGVRASCRHNICFVSHPADTLMRLLGKENKGKGVGMMVKEVEFVLRGWGRGLVSFVYLFLHMVADGQCDVQVR